MAINYNSSKHAVHRSLMALVACIFPQFEALAKGQWWLFTVIGVLMILIYRKTELYDRKGLKRAIISAQIGSFIGGISWLYFVDYRSAITLIYAVFLFVYPARWMLVMSYKIYIKQRRNRQQNQWGENQE